MAGAGGGALGHAHSNPLVDSIATTTAELLRQLEADADLPQTPAESGVTVHRRKQRLSDSYFKLQGEEWVPLVVDDPPLPARLLNRGQRAGWVLRDMVVTRLLFETGGRNSEVTGLALGDWAERGLQQEASETAKLLRRYCDGKRRPARPA